MPLVRSLCDLFCTISLVKMSVAPLTKISSKSQWLVKLVCKVYLNGSLQNGFVLLIPYLICDREIYDPITALFSPRPTRVVPIDLALAVTTKIAPIGLTVGIYSTITT